ncbi:hypothetical protein, conserved [Plasmodium gonderi]|uniref:Uncharacterized protein n=1 Tax=Plasmodium gonderi TaxID=77519 RepID=A0A1Y1JIS4_PLAGO|nr:hypothetical protein, conserved [Plasmodium gonderi]GAW80004.1 hypothetical protein, conserved [Plasmodium gonderi]
MEKTTTLPNGIDTPTSEGKPCNRSKKQIESLLYSLKKNIKNNYELTNRVYYFFPTDDILDQTLYNLCKFIPRGMDILDTDKPIKGTYDPDLFSEFIDSDTDTWDNKNLLGDDIKIIEPIPKKNEFPTSTTNLRTNKMINQSCVEWKGFVNEANGYAAVKILNPFVSQEYSTYTNRLVYFLFQKTNCLCIEDFLRIHKFVGKVTPLYMKCKNKLCVKLSHIDVTNDLYL